MSLTDQEAEAGRRETIETLGPPGILPAEGMYGPEPVHEAEAIVDALRKLLARDG